ncbi:MAG: methylmalonyl-CoA epimerase [Candidatus Zixiibacteriota bacterium]|nr:MAG: methylmalonyl-CoA epimerase [candidate division Zixibacteria bacterium]
MPVLISHVGIAVNDLEQSIERYRHVLGVAPSYIGDVSDQQVRVAFFDTGATAAGGRIELLAPTTPDSPISRFLQRRGEGLHHVCVYVENLEERLQALKAARVRLIDETPRIGAEGHRIAFVHPSATGGVLIELEERPTGQAQDV